MTALPALEPDLLARAVERVGAGGLVAYPTETVWGLGADARSEPALERLRGFKGRREEQPIALLVTGLEAAERLGLRVGEAARRLARAFWPGPLTLVLPDSGCFARGVARADGAVGLRCSSHPLASALAGELERAGFGPLTATSLNRSGEPPATGIAEARSLCAGSHEAVLLLEGPDAYGEPPSSVVDLCGEAPLLLRKGSIDEVALRAALEEEP